MDQQKRYEVFDHIYEAAVRKEGFPLDSISLDIKTNKYYYDLPEDKLEQVAVGDGFLEFFKNILNLN